MAKHSAPKRKKKTRTRRHSAKNIIALLVCAVLLCAAAALYWGAFRLKTGEPAAASGEADEWDDDFRPEVGAPPYRVAVDAGHGGSDPGADGVVLEREMTAATAQALVALLESDPNFIPLKTRESYDTTAKPSERAAYANALAPDILLSIHGNAAAEGSAASGFECYPSVPGRTYHKESYYFAKLLAKGMQDAGASLRGRGGVRYIYYLENGDKQLVETTHSEVRTERSFTLLEDMLCPVVLAEQCFVTSESDVDMFGDEDGCLRTARVYYEALCAYFGTEPV